MFVATFFNFIFCRDKHVFVATKDVLSRRDKSKQINVLLRQKYVCCDKSFVAAAYFCRDKRRVFCRQKRMLVAAPANYINQLVRIQRLDGNEL